MARIPCSITRTFATRLFAIYFLGMIISPVSMSEGLPYMEGDLGVYLQELDYGKKNDGIWDSPTPSYLSDFASMFDLFLAGYYLQAHQLGSAIGYQVIQFSNVNQNPAETHYILQEVNPLPSLDYKGSGIYIARDNGKPVVVQAPHPKSDLYTELQAIDLYLKSQAAFLAIAGTRRDSTDAVTECTGNYFASDAVHNTNHSYYVAHERANLSDQDMIFIQLHGFGRSSLSKLKTQCETDNDVLINLSEGLKYRPDNGAANFIDILADRINSGGLAKACIYGKDTRSLGGTTNTTGRYTNHSTDPCTSYAKESSHQFIHMEQSFLVRAAHRDAINSHVRSAIEGYFQ